jgi:hypothetical protein
MTDNVKDELIIERALIAFECKNQGQLADLFNISSQDLSNRKRKGTLKKLFKKEACRRGLNYEWIETGEGTPSKISEQAAAYSPGTATETAPTRAVTDLQHHELGELIKQTTEVLLSGTKYGSALKENIEAFHQAVNETKKPNDPAGTARNGSDQPPPQKKAVG